MDDSVSDETERFANPNRAHPHARIDGRVRGLGTQVVLPEREGLGQVAAPAGGLSSSANDLACWLQVQLAHGALPGGDGKRLYSEAAAREMWTPQVLTPIRAYPPPISDMTPQFSSYALGWSVQRSEEHPSELQSLMRISYAVFCLKNKHTSYSE